MTSANPVNGTSVTELLELIKQFCELIPEDYEYQDDEHCLYSVIRNYLMQAVNKWTIRELKHQDAYIKSESIEGRLSTIGETECMSKISNILKKFYYSERGTDYKLLLELF